MIKASCGDDAPAWEWGRRGTREQVKLPRRRAGDDRYGVDAPPAPEDSEEERSSKRGRREGEREHSREDSTGMGEGVVHSERTVRRNERA